MEKTTLTVPFLIPFWKENILTSHTAYLFYGFFSSLDEAEPGVEMEGEKDNVFGTRL